MTRQQIDMLKRAEKGVIWDDQPPDSKTALRYLLNAGLCQWRVDIQSGLIVITESGKAKLSEAEEAAEQKAKEESQRKFQNKVSVAQVLVPAVTFILGLIVEFRIGIIGVILQVFG